MNTIVQLIPLECSDREQFISDNQEAFNYGAMEEFGLRDDHFEEDGQIISRDTIGQSIDSGEAYRIILDGQKVGGLVIKVDGEKGDLDLLFVSPTAHSKGIGYAAWCAVEKLHPEVNVWETVTPYVCSRLKRRGGKSLGRKCLCDYSHCVYSCRRYVRHHGLHRGCANCFLLRKHRTQL